MFNRKKHILKIGILFLSGSVLLIILSFIQKIIAGFNPFILKGYFNSISIWGRIRCYCGNIHY
jgi:hypothetical protein